MRENREKALSLLLGLALLVTALSVGYLAQPETAAADPGSRLTYEVKAENARLNRKVMGEVTADVEGVPAEPVHSFVWDGDGSAFIEEASVTLEIDPIENTGEIKAEWRDRNGYWTLEQTTFAPPPHPTGAQLGSLGGSLLDEAKEPEIVFVEGDPVVVDAYLHGDTTAGGPVLPTLFNELATWGPAEVTLNGEPFENPFDGPAPLWVVHTMTTAGVRNDDGEVRMQDGSLYNPMKQTDVGAIDYGDKEFHLVFHDAPGPEMTNNFPPPLSFFYHLTFEDVKVEISHSQ